MHVDKFLEVEEPERQLEVARVDHVGALPEAAAVFVVAVEQQDAHDPGGPFMISCRMIAGAARLAHAGRAQDGEMLAQEIVDLDTGRDLLVLMQSADVDRGDPPRRRRRAADGSSR